MARPDLPLAGEFAGGPIDGSKRCTNRIETVKRLGVHPVLISREVNGKTKYQVEIGPFVTQKEAIHAGEVLGQKYSDSLNCSWGNCDWQYTWIGSPSELLCSNASAFCKPDE